MKGSYLVVIALVLVVIGMLLYPSLHDLIGGVDTTGYLPLLKAAVISMPYLFLGFIVYAIIQQAKR